MPRTSQPIKLREGLIWVTVLARTDRGTFRRFEFVLDPGSSQTIFSRWAAKVIGFPESKKTGDTGFDSVTGHVPAYTFDAPALIALGRELNSYPVAAKTFPPKLRVDGVLGLDFFAGADLLINLRTGVLELEW